MENNKLDFFYAGKDTEKFQYIPIPYVFFTNPQFTDLSLHAKLTYSILLNRLNLSIVNEEKYSDKDSHVFVVLTIEEAMRLLDCGKNKAVDTFKELSDKGLILKRKADGYNNTNLIYVMNFSSFDYINKTESNLPYDYFYAGTDIEAYQFVQMPYLFLSDNTYQKLSLRSKFLYSFLYNNVSLSLKNKDRYSDDEGKVFVLFSIEKTQSLLNCSNRVAVNSYKELEKFGLIHKERSTGFDSKNHIYVMNFSSMTAEKTAETVGTVESDENKLSRVTKTNLRECRKQTIESDENKPSTVTNVNLRECRKQTFVNDECKPSRVTNVNPIYTNNIYTKENHNHNQPQSYIGDRELTDIDNDYSYIFLKNEDMEYLYNGFSSKFIKAINLQNQLDDSWDMFCETDEEIVTREKQRLISKEIVINLLSTINDNRDFLTINRINIPKEKIRNQLLKATEDDFVEVQERILKNKVLHLGGYAITVFMQIIMMRETNYKMKEILV